MGTMPVREAISEIVRASRLTRIIAAYARPMADEDDSLHDSWAPPPSASAPDPDADGPTAVMPVEPSASEPVPAADAAPPSRRRWPGSAKAVVALLVIALAATVVGLGYGWSKTNDDKKDLETASNQQGAELSAQ